MPTPLFNYLYLLWWKRIISQLFKFLRTPCTLYDLSPSRRFFQNLPFLFIIKTDILSTIL